MASVLLGSKTVISLNNGIIHVYFKVYMQGKMKNLKFRNLERNDLP